MNHLVGEHIRDALRKATGHQMVFQDDEAVRVVGALLDEVHIDRLESEDVDHAHRDALIGHRGCRLHGLGDHLPMAEQRDVGALAGDDASADADIELVKVVDDSVLLADTGADVQGPGQRHGLLQHLSDHHGITDRHDRHVHQRAHQPQVLDGVVRGAAVALQATVRPDDAHRKVRITHIGAHLLECPHAQEGQHARHDADIALVSQSGGHADSCLLGQTHVDEPFRESFPELHQRRADIRGDCPQIRMLLTQLSKGLTRHRA
ncbi:hypothetical protein SDC9_140883 [bioreactor metagenome]|uniref:Uncharacterized protein n=1 Tax=bioreactor metagenome TaxID=1076179 RepID=A0A645DWP8_9ZZZZ